MTVGSGGCAISNGDITVDENYLILTYNTSPNIVYSINRYKLYKGWNTSNTGITEIVIYVNGDKKSYITDFTGQYLDRSILCGYFATDVNIFITNGLPINKHFICHPILKIESSNSIIACPGIESIVNSDGNLYMTIPLGTELPIGVSGLTNILIANTALVEPI